MKNNSFALFARAFFIFWDIEDVLVLSTTWNDLFCSCVEDMSIWWQMFNFAFLCPKRWFKLNSRIIRTHFSSIMTLNNWKIIAETRSYIFRWRSRFRLRRVCLSSLLNDQNTWHLLLWLHDLLRIEPNNQIKQKLNENIKWCQGCWPTPIVLKAYKTRMWT